MGWARPPSIRPNQWVAGGECRTVSIEGLSSSTTDMQLRNLLRSIGPIEVGKSRRYDHWLEKDRKTWKGATL